MAGQRDGLGIEALPRNRLVVCSNVDKTGIHSHEYHRI